MKQIVVPNFCSTCGEKVPDKMKFRISKIKESPKEVRIAICEHCGNDLSFGYGTLIE